MAQAQKRISELPTITSSEIDFTNDILPLVGSSSTITDKTTIEEFSSGVLGGLQYKVVDTLAELTAALLLGGTIIIRGTITVTSQLTIGIAGTKILGYGYTSGSTSAYSTLIFSNSSAATKTSCFLVNAVDCEIRGFEIKSNEPEINPPNSNQRAIEFTNGTCHRTLVRDMHIHHFSRPVSQDGGVTSIKNDDIRIENNYIHSFGTYGMLLEFGLNRLRVDGNTIIGRTGNSTHAVSGNCMVIGGAIFDCVIANNYCENTDRMGIEVINVTTSALTHQSQFDDPTQCGPNHRTKIYNNSVKNCKSFGISVGHGKGCIVDNNTIENVSGIGLETSAATGDYSNNIISNNWIKNVNFQGALCLGISCDKMYGDIIKGNRIENLPTTGLPYGIQVYQSQNITVENNSFESAGIYHLFVNGGGLSNTLGQNTLKNNTFKNGDFNWGGGSGRAIYIFEQPCQVNDNVLYRKTGQTFVYEVNCNSPAGVYCDHSHSGIVRAGGFSGSNLMFNY